MARPAHDSLSRRERQIMDVVYRRGRATAAEVQGELPDPPSYSAVRALLRVLEEKGHLRHEQDGPAIRVPADGAPRQERGARPSASSSKRSSTARRPRPSPRAARRPRANLTDEEIDRLSRPDRPGPQEGTLTMEPLLDLVRTSSALDTWQAFALEGTLRATLAMATAALVGAALWRAYASVDTWSGRRLWPERWRRHG